MSNLSPETIESIGALLRTCEAAHLGVQITKVVDGWEVWCVAGESADLVAEADEVEEALADATTRIEEIASRVRRLGQ